MKKKKLVEVQLVITLDRKPTETELHDLLVFTRNVFPRVTITYLEKWERETKV